MVSRARVSRAIVSRAIVSRARVSRAEQHLVKVEAIAQLRREVVAHLGDEDLDLEHGAEEEGGGEREVARHGEVGVLLAAEGRGDARDQHEGERDLIRAR
eukprot:scaffold89409_cov53-Phaeocystis_antarctica.AAC.1